MHKNQCSCGCHHGCGHRRRYYTKAERLERLQAYVETLKKELQAAEEHVKDLQG